MVKTELNMIFPLCFSFLFHSQFISEAAQQHAVQPLFMRTSPPAKLKRVRQFSGPKMVSLLQFLGKKHSQRALTEMRITERQGKRA